MRSIFQAAIIFLNIALACGFVALRTTGFEKCTHTHVSSLQMVSVFGSKAGMGKKQSNVMEITVNQRGAKTVVLETTEKVNLRKELLDKGMYTKTYAYMYAIHACTRSYAPRTRCSGEK
jgi:hypothetical protein